MTEWAGEFGELMYIHAADRQCVPRTDPLVRFWESESEEIGDGLTLINAALQPSDVLVITRLSRAMRSLRHLLDLADSLRERGIGLKVLKQDIDTTTPTGRLVFHILGAIDEFQHELIVEGTREGLAAAREHGRTGGRPPALSPEQAEQTRNMIADVKPVTEVARVLKASRASVYRAFEREKAAAS